MHTPFNPNSLIDMKSSLIKTHTRTSFSLTFIALTPLRCHTPPIDALLITHRQTVEQCINVRIVVPRQAGARIRPSADRIDALRLADRFTVTIDQPVAPITNAHIRLHTMPERAPVTQRYTLVPNLAVLCMTDADPGRYAITIRTASIAHRLTHERGGRIFGRMSWKAFTLIRPNARSIPTRFGTDRTTANAIVHVSFRTARRWCGWPNTLSER